MQWINEWKLKGTLIGLTIWGFNGISIYIYIMCIYINTLYIYNLCIYRYIMIYRWKNQRNAFEYNNVTMCLFDYSNCQTKLQFFVFFQGVNYQEEYFTGVYGRYRYVDLIDYPRIMNIMGIFWGKVMERGDILWEIQPTVGWWSLIGLCLGSLLSGMITTIERICESWAG